MIDNTEVYKLKKIIGKNLTILIEDVLHWTKSKFADVTGIAQSTLSNYLDPDKDTSRIPPLEYMVTVCLMKELKEMGINLTMDLLISDKFNPKELINKRDNHPSVTRKQSKHGGYYGNYICYFYDQSKPVNNHDCKSNRELRYGVISIFDDCESLLGDTTIRAIASFFKEAEFDKASELKKSLDKIFKNNDIVKNRNADIENAFNSNNISAYEGKVNFSDHHIFINVQSNIYGDNALIIMYSPQKKIDTDYIGGIGSVASIARGRTHMPTAQKIIMSKYELGCSREIIMENLKMSVATIDQEDAAKEICKFCNKLYLNPEYANNFDDADKVALIKRRLDQLVKIYIDKNICCVGTVTEDEDKAIFKLIEQFKD